MKRSEIEDKFKWDLSYIIKDEHEFLELIKEAEKSIKILSKFENKLKSKDMLLEFFKFDSKLSKIINRLYTYSFLQLVTNIADVKWNKVSNQIQNLYTKYCVAISFANPEICALDIVFLQELINDQDFLDYNRIIENAIKQKPHVLSSSEEKLLSGMTNFTDYSSVYSSLNNSELKFGKVEIDGKKEEITHSKYQVFLRNKSQKVRKNTYDSMHKTYGKFNLTLAQNYINSLKYVKYISEVRHFDSAFDMACFEEEVDTKIFQSLIKVVEKNLGSFQKYFKLKKEKLKVENIYLSDVYINPSKCPEKKYEYKQMVQLVKDALTPLGKDYCKMIEEAVDKRWVDVFPNENKESGAFETSCGIGVPYIKLNFENDYNGVTTFAHEFGHAMHSYYTEHAQPYEKQKYEIFVAEVASTVNEILLNNYMVEHSTNTEERNYYVEELLTEYTAAVFYQSLYGEFEYIINNKLGKDEPISYDDINKTFIKLLNKYFGKEVEKSKWAKYGWSRIPHFYTPFYVYKYSTSFLISVLISEKILKEGKPFVTKYIQFLKSGSSKSPVDLLKICGIDADSEHTYEEAFEHYKKLIDLYNI